ncbi:MAG: class I SAM-dependent methyltransferase [Rickettsiales bacterium]
MKAKTHSTAKPTHYNEMAKYYDEFNEKRSATTNATIEKILKKYKVKSVLDLTCGTGSQVFWLLKRGFYVVGCDINAKMLKIAKAKAKQEKLDINFHKGDMRTSKIGSFDAVLTIFNAVGHLTKKDFTRAMKNIAHNLKPKGLYVFDIFNLTYLKKDNNITKLTIDRQEVSGAKLIRKIQYSTISKDGVLASFTTRCEQEGEGRAKLSKDVKTLQVYTKEQLGEMLLEAGFKVLSVQGIDGGKFFESKSERMLVVATRN